MMNSRRGKALSKESRDDGELAISGLSATFESCFRQHSQHRMKPLRSVCLRPSYSESGRGIEVDYALYRHQTALLI